jgi:hypothetical protein
MATKRSVIQNGTPPVYEAGIAQAEVRPGYLVSGVTTHVHHATAGGNTAKQVALERDELGLGIDNTYRSADQATAYYASGDRVKVAIGRPGDRFTAFLASGRTVAIGDLLESNGDGTLRPFGSGTTLFRAIDAVSAGVAAVTAFTVEAL